MKKIIAFGFLFFLFVPILFPGDKNLIDTSRQPKMLRIGLPMALFIRYSHVLLPKKEL
jgi:hypothetical protein